MKTSQLIYSALLSALLLVACGEKKTASDLKQEEALPVLEENAGNFDPSDQPKGESAHRALTIVVDSAGNYALDTLSLSEPLRKGIVPFGDDDKESRNALPFKVSWLDANGKRIGGYSMEAPLLMRSCEEGKELVRTLPQGRFEVLLPARGNISSVQLSQNGKAVAEIRLARK